MIKKIVVSVLLWWAAIMAIFAACNVAKGQTLPAPDGIATCADVFAVEAMTAEQAGYTGPVVGKDQYGSVSFAWGKGGITRVVLFVPEVIGPPPAGSPFKLMGRCSHKGEVFLISKGIVGGKGA